MLKRFDMQDCKTMDTPIPKGDKFNVNQCLKGYLEIQENGKDSLCIQLLGV